MDKLPLEIVNNIVKYFSREDFATSRLICREWTRILNGISDETWRCICRNDFGSFTEGAHYKAKLDWRDMNKSLHHWRDLRYDKLIVKKLPIRMGYIPMHNGGYFQLLNDGLLAITQNSGNNVVDGIFYGHKDSIMYYDLHLDMIVSKFELEFKFSTYAENDRLIAVIHIDGRLCVVNKFNNQKKFLGPILGKFTLIKDQVYYQDVKDMLMVAQLIHRDDSTSIVTTPLHSLDERLLAVHYINKNLLKILTEIGNIYEYSNGKLVFCSELTNHDDAIQTLARHGFDWTSGTIYEWIQQSFTPSHMLPYQPTAVCVHGKIYIAAAHNKSINFHYNPSNPYLRFELQPMRSVEMGKMLLKPSCIRQIDVWEADSGHRVILAMGQKIFVLEFENRGKVVEPKSFLDRLKRPRNPDSSESSSDSESAESSQSTRPLAENRRAKKRREQGNDETDRPLRNSQGTQTVETYGSREIIP